MLKNYSYTCKLQVKSFIKLTPEKSYKEIWYFKIENLLFFWQFVEKSFYSPKTWKSCPGPGRRKLTSLIKLFLTNHKLIELATPKNF